MRSGVERDQPTAAGGDGSDYESPQLEVLGTLADLTQLGAAPTDELLNDGSQA